jgi:FkbM family methyltransferase
MKTNQTFPNNYSFGILSDLKLFLDKYQIQPKGVIHIGAHMASEAKLYEKIGLKKVLWLEANPNLMNSIQENISSFPEQQAFNVAVSDVDHEIIELNLSQETQNSSLLKPLNIKVYYPSSSFKESVQVESRRMDSFLPEKQISLLDYNIINIDIQGSELSALKGFGTLLQQIDCINSEVNYTHLYDSGTLMHELDIYLAKYNFLRMQTFLTKRGWGDALYLKVDNIHPLDLWKRTTTARLYILGFWFVTGFFTLLNKLNITNILRNKFPKLYEWLVAKF